MFNNTEERNNKHILLSERELLEFANIHTLYTLTGIIACVTVTPAIIIPVLILLSLLFFPGKVLVKPNMYWLIGVSLLVFVPAIVGYRYWKKRYETLERKYFGV